MKFTNPLKNLFGSGQQTVGVAKNGSAILDVPKKPFFQLNNKKASHFSSPDAFQRLKAEQKSGPSLIDRVKAVGQSLKDPATIKQAAIEIGLNAAVMGTAKIAVGAALTATSAPALVAFGALAATTGVVGGLLKSRRQYNAAKKVWEQTHDKEDRFQNRRSYLWENKKQLGLSMLTSAGMGLVGGVAGHAFGSLIQHASPHVMNLVHEVTPHITKLFNHASTPVTGHLTAGHTSSTHLSLSNPAQPEIGPTAIQKAAAAILEDKNASDYAKYSAKEALKGRPWAQTNIAHFLNNAKEGVDLDKTLAHDVTAEIVKENKAPATIAKLAKRMLAHMEGRPVPVHTDLASHASHVTHLAAERDEPWYHVAATDPDADTSVASTLPADQVPLVNALAAPAPVAAIDPQTVIGKPKIISTCKLTDVPNAPADYGMKCTAVSDTQMMQAPYKVRVNYTNPQGYSASEDVSLNKDFAPMKAKAFQAWFQNDKGYMNGMQERLRGIATRKFQIATGQIPSGPVQALNDNVLTASVQPQPKIFAFK